MGDVLWRILSRLEAPLLQRHCCDVLDEELRCVRAELDEVLAAYGRLQEVREAVASLEHERSDVRRSASLMETVDTTSMLHRDLAQRMNVLEMVLRARPVVKLSGEETETNSKADNVDERSRHDAKRKRIESDHEVVKEEAQESRDVLERPRNSKKAQHESPAIEAARSYEALMATSWESPKQQVGSDPSSDTESEEDEPMPMLHLSREDTKPQSTEDPLTTWSTQVVCALQVAQELVNAKKAPVEKLAPLVEDVRAIVESIPSNHGSHFRLLVDGQLKELISVTTRILTFGKRNASYFSITESLITVFKAAIAKDSSMQGLGKFVTSLSRSNATMEERLRKDGEKKTKSTSAVPTEQITSQQAQSKTHGSAQMDDKVSLQWARDVLETSKFAQRLESADVAPDTFDLDQLVQQVAQHLMTVPTTPSGDVNSLTRGQFANLLALTTRLFEMGNRKRSYLQLIDFAIAAFDTAISNNEDLASLTKYRESLVQSKPTMQSSKHIAATEPVSATATPDTSGLSGGKKWKKAVHQLLSLAQRLSVQAASVSLDEVIPFADDFTTILATVSSSNPTEVKNFANEDLFNLIASTVRIFKRSELDSSYLQPLVQIIKSVDTLTGSNRRFRGCSQYGVELGAQRNRLTKMKQSHQPPVPTETSQSNTSSTESVATRFEALLSAADELLALPLSERRGRVSNYTFSLQKELRATFPTTGRRPTPLREALETAADAVKKAAELVQDEPHTENNDTFYKQFLELLFSIGSRFNLFKQLVARSRDDLYLYLYPDSNPPKNTHPKKSKASDGSSDHPEETALRRQFLEVYKRVQSWHDDVFSLKEFDEVMRVLRAVMAHKSKTWRVLRDRTVGDCLDLVSKRAHAIKKVEHREGRLASITQWQSQFDY